MERGLFTIEARTSAPTAGTETLGLLSWELFSSDEIADGADVAIGIDQQYTYFSKSLNLELD